MNDPVNADPNWDVQLVSIAIPPILNNLVGSNPPIGQGSYSFWDREVPAVHKNLIANLIPCCLLASAFRLLGQLRPLIINRFKSCRSWTWSVILTSWPGQRKVRLGPPRPRYGQARNTRQAQMPAGSGLDCLNKTGRLNSLGSWMGQLKNIVK